MMKLDAKALRLSDPTEEHKKLLKKNAVYIIVDNVLDTYNIGSIFRLADAVAVQKVYLCAGAETPPNSRIKKASINTTEWVDWEYFPTAIEAIKDLRAKVKDIQIVSVELNDKSVPYDQIDYQFPIAIIVGHETDGVSQEAMDASDYIAEMPMWGVNISLNVMVSLGIMLYKVMERATRNT
jgi:23S rRNA (guanosine2251-2'-O)-methyltransferase